MRKILILLLLITVILTTSCHRRDLVYAYYPACDITLVIDWTKAFKPEKKPTGVSVWFYPKDGSEPIMTRSADVDSVRVSLESGIYDIVVFNQMPFEFSTIGFRGTDKLSTLEVYTRPTANTNWYTTLTGIPVQRNPEDFACKVYRDFEITEDMVKASVSYREQYGERPPPTKHTVIHTTPDPIVKRILVIARIDGIQNLHSSRAGILGMTESYFVDSEENSVIETAYLLATWTKHVYPGSTTEGEIRSYYTSFGLKADKKDGGKNNDFDGMYDYWTGNIELQMKLQDLETQVNHNVNLSEKHLSIEEEEVHVVIRIGFDINERIVLPDVDPPDDNQGGSGFDPDVDDWEEESVEIPI